MAQFLLSLYQPDSEPPISADLDLVSRDVAAWQQEAVDARAWVISGGLHPPGKGAVVRADHDSVLVTEGPYLEGIEHIGGFVVIGAPNLDAALEWGAKLSRAATLPVEVRPIRAGRT